MYTVQIEFKIMETSRKDDQLDAINSLLGVWRMNGQVLGREFPIAEKNESYFVFVQVPDENALSLPYNNKYVNQYLDKLEKEFSLPEISVLGIDPDSSNVCDCTTSSYYILFTTFLSLESPLNCGDCFNMVPLYKVPKTYDDEYYNILCWMSDYQSCDSLQMNCSVGERFATDQLSKLDSALTKLGLNVRDSIQEATGKKTYYYLYKGSGKSYDSELNRKCPKCNDVWYQQEPVHNIFDFMCKKCGLLSNVAWNCRK